MTFCATEEQPIDNSEKQARMGDTVKQAATGNIDNYCDTAATTTKKKHANPFSVEYILSCESSKKHPSRRNPQVESKLQKEAIDYAYVNKNYNTLAYGQPPVSTTTSDVETIGKASIILSKDE